MRRGILLLTAFVLGGATAGGVCFWLLARGGIEASREPSRLEASVARRLRAFLTPGAARRARNPVPASPEVMARARAHFADHCAICHGNDGKGETTIGRKLYPRAPDMTTPDTQSLSDGEIFHVIKHGVRMTGMPAWGEDTPEDDRESWELVHFIRRLPRLTPDELVEMRALNPRSRRQWEEEESDRRFLEGGEAPAPSPQTHGHH